jgi:glycosyltransferase involved in cell wall biosynthesis
MHRMSETNSSSPAVSVIVPCRNEITHIEACIRSILDQEPPTGGFEVIVADGMSDDGTRQILDQIERQNPSLKVIDNPARIVSCGLNAAIKASRGDVIIRMDAHTQYAPDYVRQCVRTLGETNADNVGGSWTAKGNGFLSGAIAAAFRSPFGVGGARGHNEAYEGIVDTVYLGCWRRDLFNRIGFFDEGLVRNQDDEFNLRLTRAGGKIWQSPRIKSWYTPRGSLRALFRQYMQYGYWKVRVIQKHKIPASVRHVVPGCFVLLLLALPLLSPLWSPALWIWLATVGVYGVCNVAASIVTAAREKFQFVLVLPVVFADYHVAYGYGFLRGIFDFMILRRQPSNAYIALTRTSADPSGNARRVADE